ncbi:MAG: hypothetical protein AAFX87_00055 [Bacteroidota bacterium]
MIIIKYFWVLFIATTVINAFILRARSKKYTAEKPQLKEGYNKLFKGFIIYTNIPWVIMMIGDLTGSTQNVFEYLNPRSLNPVVLLFHLSLIILWFLLVRWIYFKRGAEFLEKHPGFIRVSGIRGRSDVTAKQIKFFLPIMILGGVFAMIMMWFSPIPSTELIQP